MDGKILTRKQALDLIWIASPAGFGTWEDQNAVNAAVGAKRKFTREDVRRIIEDVFGWEMPQ